MQEIRQTVLKKLLPQIIEIVDKEVAPVIEKHLAGSISDLDNKIKLNQNVVSKIQDLLKSDLVTCDNQSIPDL